jgi:hypothetical protein
MVCLKFACLYVYSVSIPNSNPKRLFEVKKTFCGYVVNEHLSIFVIHRNERGGQNRSLCILSRFQASFRPILTYLLHSDCAFLILSWSDTS